MPLKELQDSALASALMPAEPPLYRLLGELPEIRDAITHRTSPNQLDVSVAAMC
jgi:hypothetical protein